MSAPAASAVAPLLSFRSVSKAYHNGPAVLDRVSFDVAPGEFCVLLGRSGAGKSTLLRLVNGLTEASSGEVQMQGQPLTRKNLSALRQHVSTIHQQFNLVQRASVALNVLSGAMAVTPLWRTGLGWYPQARRERAAELVQRVGLTAEQMFRRAQELSGGQQQRVGIARAFMLDPELILADEPVASLDPRVAREVLALLQSAARERGAAVLCSLHQLDLAREFGDRIVAIQAGRVIFDGAPEYLSDAVIESIYGRPEAAAEPMSDALADAPLLQLAETLS